MSSTVEQVAEAVLYEGYLLFPYRPSARKNQQRWTFGCIYPKGTDEPSEMQTQCLLWADGEASIEPAVRFLHVCAVDHREEAIERSFQTRLPLGTSTTVPIAIEAGSGAQPLHDLSLAAAYEEVGWCGTWAGLQGEIEAYSEVLSQDLWRLTVRIRNTAQWGADAREQALRRTFVSAHTILRAHDGQFVSLLDPPEELREAAGECRNLGTWPVLVDNAQTMLSSPIILYDYPEVSPQSPGALFDTTEIDELLTLSVLAMTDREKAEIIAADARGRELLERTESLTPEQILELHGVMRELR